MPGSGGESPRLSLSLSLSPPSIGYHRWNALDRYADGTWLSRTTCDPEVDPGWPIEMTASSTIPHGMIIGVPASPCCFCRTWKGTSSLQTMRLHATVEDTTIGQGRSGSKERLSSAQVCKGDQRRPQQKGFFSAQRTVSTRFVPNAHLAVWLSIDLDDRMVDAIAETIGSRFRFISTSLQKREGEGRRGDLELAASLSPLVDCGSFFFHR